ncbi:unnamed protein product [Didymodactylos carnosus]|uniref:Leucine zipper transcription factor-like protein 1 n=1 Tax=Didymodactylos carnosus TaxID=1234261 RepID=A0A8S2Q8J7_9BILA|nr:unnamed protein product [Didymodactylos carnosus]CAF4094522.1 unnamed protein product [Didymodactylos carnosus]
MITREGMFENKRFPLNSGDRSYSVKIDQINDTQTTILLKTEIQKLQQLNDQMKKKIQQYEKDLNIKDSTYEMSLNDQLLEKANLKLEKEQVSKEKQSYEKEMQSSQTRLVELQKQLEMTEHELDKKFNQTNTYKNMKSMLESKNETIKQLRRQLGEGNSGDYGSQEEDD